MPFYNSNYNAVYEGRQKRKRHKSKEKEKYFSEQISKNNFVQFSKQSLWYQLIDEGHQSKTFPCYGSDLDVSLNSGQVVAKILLHCLLSEQEQSGFLQQMFVDSENKIHEPPTPNQLQVGSEIWIETVFLFWMKNKRSCFPHK